MVTKVRNNQREGFRMKKKQIVIDTIGFIQIFLMIIMCTIALGAEKLQKPPELVIGGGSATGFTAILGEAASEAIRRSFRSWSITSSAGEVASNIKFIHDGKMQLSIAYPELVNEANHGTGVYKEPMPDIKIVANYTKYPAQFVLLPKVAINSFEEWKQKKLPLRVNVQKRGSGSEVLNNRILQAYGISYENIKYWGGSVRFEGGSDSMDLIRDGLLDASLFSGDCPSTAIKELSTSRTLKMIPIDQKIVAELARRYGYIGFTVKAGTYSWQKKDIETVAEGVTLAASTKLPPGVVKDITKAQVEQLEYLRAVHQSLKTLTITDLADIPVNLIHPEAREFYESKGIKFK